MKKRYFSCVVVLAAAMSYEDLRMFARFPQGIPPNLDLKTLR